MTPAIRLTSDRLAEITGKRRPSAQARWFRTHFGITLPCDPAGPVITAAAFELLSGVRCGVITTVAPVEPPPPRPKLVPKKTRHETPKKPPLID